MPTDKEARKLFKCFPNQSYEGDELMLVQNAIRKIAGQDGNICIKIESFINRRGNYWQMRIGLKFNKRFVNTLEKNLAEPKFVLKGLLDREGTEQIELQTDELDLKERDVFNNNVTSYSKRKMFFPKSATVGFKYSLILEWKSKKYAGATKPDYYKLLNDKILTDCIVVTSNNEEKPCHQCILAAGSDVFKAMFNIGLSESQLRKIVLQDVTENCFNKLLEHLYGREFKRSQMTQDVAIELIQVAHRYMILDLVAKVTDFLLDMPSRLYTMDNVLELYYFSEKVEYLNMLANKMLCIMKTNCNKLKAAPAYQELKEQQPEQAADLENQISASRKHKRTQSTNIVENCVGMIQ
ncbi:unnamed protein product [Orchesella dallaii]|uniref:BTB domain-containing protein n=1 Tax=Orchesella dallaii TaxID=48710 RepID=A0ABP1PJM9_9HEXA